jgi:thiol:disulfide interchange protein
VLPYAWGLGFAVWLLPGHTPEAVGSALLGLIATSLTYWLYILPSSWRKKIQMCRPFRSTIHHPVEAQPQSEIL